MRILVAHNSYQYAGGEDSVVANEEALLRGRGHEVFPLRISNDGIRGAWRTAVTAWQVPYSRWGRREAARVIGEVAPDIVHVHNFFPLLTPSVYDACRDARVPVVQTLHNYRAICAGADLFRANKPCEDCIRGTPYQGALHGCYRGSRLGSLAVARMVDYHRKRGTWATKVDRFIALTEFAKGKFIEAGFPEIKIAVKPNFAAVEHSDFPENTERQGALFVGRLSPEKGLGTLLRAFRSVNVPLRIIGDGPLLSRIHETTLGHVVGLGRQEPAQVAEEMARAVFLVLPSECYENFPVTIAEAFAQGLPVIASRLGAMAEIVGDGVTGLHFTPGDAENLAAKVRWAADHPEAMRRMGANARQVYEEKYTPDVNYGQLIRIFEEAKEVNRQRQFLG